MERKRCNDHLGVIQVMGGELSQGRRLKESKWN